MKLLPHLLKSLPLVWCLIASSVFADSDSAFCSAPGYLAYELRAEVTPGVTGHVLRVIKFEAPHGIYLVGEVKLKDFQPHRMICANNRVEISGWSNKFHNYVIEIAPPDRLRILDYKEDATRKFDPAKDGPEPLQLGYSKPQIVALESSDSEHRYELRISASHTAAKNGLQHHRQAELVQLDKKNNITQRVNFYERYWLEAGD